MVIVFLVFVSFRKTHNLLYCGYTRTKIVFLCLSCFIVLNQGLYYVVVCVCASHSCTTYGNPLSVSDRED